MVVRLRTSYLLLQLGLISRLFSRFLRLLAVCDFLQVLVVLFHAVEYQVSLDFVHFFLTFLLNLVFSLDFDQLVLAIKTFVLLELFHLRLFRFQLGQQRSFAFKELSLGFVSCAQESVQLAFLVFKLSNNRAVIELAIPTAVHRVSLRKNTVLIEVDLVFVCCWSCYERCRHETIEGRLHSWRKE